MSFKLVARNTVLVPVKGTLPDEQGKPEPFKFTLVCKRLGQDELTNEMRSDNERTLKEFMSPLIEGWRDVLDEEGAPIPFGQQAIDSLLDIAGMARVVFDAYAQEQAAKAKN
jgi:hypothetical protein